MAQYKVTHKCGCEVTHQLYGKHTDRDSKLEWLKTQPCWECEKKARAEAAAAKNAGMPELTGSEKQIAWAEQIRAKQIDQLNQATAKMNTRDQVLTDAPDKIELYDLTVKVIDDIKNETSAKWWIENRDCSGIELLNRTLKTHREVAA
jgi:hypothetical protein